MRLLRSKPLGALALALVAAAVAVPLVVPRVDGAFARAAVGARLEAAFGQHVELGAVTVSLLPPGAHIRDVRIGAAPGLRLAAPELRVGASLLALLTGRVVLDSVELTAPRLTLPSAGAPVPPAANGAVRSRWDTGDAPRAQLALNRLVVRHGTLEVGGRTLRGVELRGHLMGSDGFTLEFAIQGPRGGVLADGTVELSGLPAALEQLGWTLEARLEGADLAEWREPLGLPALWGSVSGTANAAGRGLRSERIALALASEDLDARFGALRIAGPVQLAGDLPGELRLDLSQARLGVPGAAEKPAGVGFRVATRVADGAGGGELRIDAQAVQASGRLVATDAGFGLELASGRIDLAALSAWTPPTWLPRAGRVELSSARMAVAPLALEVDATLDGVIVPLPGDQLEAMVSGPVHASGSLLRGELRVALADRAVVTGSVRYDWQAHRLALRAQARGVRLESLARVLANRTDLSGGLYADLELAGPPDPYGLRGSGSFELQDGELPGISIARFVANLEHPVREPEGLDRLERLRGHFRVEGERVHFDELVLAQEYATATVQGDLALRDLGVDMTGEVLLDYPELPAPSVRPIMRMGGTLLALEPHISETDGADPETRRLETAMIEAIRRAEAAQQAARRAGRKAPSAAADPEGQAATESDTDD